MSCEASCDVLQTSEWKGQEAQDLGEGKPGGFPYFGGQVLIQMPTFVPRTLSGMFLEGPLIGPRHHKKDNSGKLPEKIWRIPKRRGKAPKGQERTNRRRTSPNRETHPVWNPAGCRPLKVVVPHVMWVFLANCQDVLSKNEHIMRCVMHTSCAQLLAYAVDAWTNVWGSVDLGEGVSGPEAKKSQKHLEKVSRARGPKSPKKISKKVRKVKTNSENC